MSKKDSYIRHSIGKERTEWMNDDENMEEESIEVGTVHALPKG